MCLNTSKNRQKRILDLLSSKLMTLHARLGPWGAPPSCPQSHSHPNGIHVGVLWEDCIYLCKSLAPTYQCLLLPDRHFCSILGVEPLAPGWTDDDNLFCGNTKNYAESPPDSCWLTILLLYWFDHWSYISHQRVYIINQVWWPDLCLPACTYCQHTEPFLVCSTTQSGLQDILQKTFCFMNNGFYVNIAQHIF